MSSRRSTLQRELHRIAATLEAQQSRLRTAADELDTVIYRVDQVALSLDDDVIWPPRDDSEEGTSSS